MNNQRGQSEVGYVIGLVVVILLLVAAAVLALSFHRIDIGHAGVVISYTGDAKSLTDTKVETFTPGTWFWVMPWDFKKVVDYPMAQQTMTMVRRVAEGKVQADDSVECQVAGGAKVNVDSSAIWRVDPDNVAKLYILRPGLPLVASDPKDQNDIGDQIVRREVRNAITLACTNLTFDQVFGVDRILLGQKAGEILKPNLAKSYLLMDSFFLGEIYPQKEQQDGMNAVINAQLAAKASSFAKEKATNEAAGTVATAEGQKTATILQAQAQAEYIRITTEQLNVSPKYIEYTYAKEWNGVLPTTLIMSDGRSLPLLGALSLSPAPVAPITTTAPSK